MNKEIVFSIWAPEASPWSRWAKPILFSLLDLALSETPCVTQPRFMNWLPAPEEGVAIVLDLPSSEGVEAGIELAERGYRPVPLYNALPAPFTPAVLPPVLSESGAAVDVRPIVNALTVASLRLARISLPVNAPPVFLLDSNRQGDGRRILENQFDNRSICFTTDFPSANFLQANGIKRCLLVQRSRTFPQEDLSHVLLRWQDGGIILESARVDVVEGRQSLTLTPPSWYGMMFQRALAAAGLRRAPRGGFGAWVVASAGG